MRGNTGVVDEARVGTGVKGGKVGPTVVGTTIGGGAPLETIAAFIPG